MRLWFQILLRFISGTYFVLTSLYCLLAFLPYTFYFLIKAPPYPWMLWFMRHQAGLYWVAAAAAVAANWLVGASWRIKDVRSLSGVGLLVAAGVYLNFRPFLPGLEDSPAAYGWSLAALVALIAVALSGQRVRQGEHDCRARPVENRPFAYSVGLLIAGIISLVYALGARIHLYRESAVPSLRWADAVLTLWSVLSHLVLAIGVLSVVNLIFLGAAKTARPQAVRRGVNGALIFACLWTLLFHFLEDALSFGGWQANLYSATLALALTLWGFSLLMPLLKRQSANSSGGIPWFRIGPWLALSASALFALVFPDLVAGTDWNGFFHSAVTLVIWTVVSLSLFRLRPRRIQYSTVSVLMVVVISGVAYKTIEASEIFWSKSLGSTDGEISLSLEAYAGHDDSFQLAHRILDNSHGEACGSLCRILREYTNIRDTRAQADVKLVDALTRTEDERPNIFVFVIDSMRPDYLGAYNPRVDYTPNLDALARDSIVLDNVYSQYAGTSLSEPAIWTGAMMLHAHYLQPFSRLNSLERMLHADDYRMVVSMDEVLSVVLSGDDDLVKLDTDKKVWNELELGSTLQQVEAGLDSWRNRDQPVFLYTQPKNVHQFAHNNLPSLASQHWQPPAGMNARITFELHWVDSCLGQFFSFLKQRGMYDNSIIIVTSDHGDATGEWGRTSHSTSIWPEIMRVPLILHLPEKMRERFVYDDTRISTLTDIAPTLYYLLGHRPIRDNPLYGRPLLAETKQELEKYPRHDLLLASDVRAVYGILTADQRFLYVTYDSPAQSYFFDLEQDPNATHNIVTPALKDRYDEEILEQLRLIADYYGYKPAVGSLLAPPGQ